MFAQRQTIESASPVHEAPSSILFSQTRRLSFDHDNGRLKTEQIRLGDVGFRTSRVLSTGHSISLVEDSDVTFLLPRAGQANVRIAGRDYRIDGRHGALIRPHARETSVRAAATGAYEGHVLMLPYAQIREIARAAGAAPFLERDVIPLSGTSALRLWRCVALLLSGLDRAYGWPRPRAEAVAALLQDALGAWLAEAEGDLRERSVPTLDEMRVLRAVEIFRARSDDAITVLEVAQSLGVGLRSLQLAFQSVLGEGPRSRLTRIRLERARARLIAAEGAANVTDIAFECGFTHLSRFAAAYLRTYGERPSETLAPRRRVGASFGR